MLGYDFEIIYKKGKQCVVADALSRKDEDVEALLSVIFVIQPDWINTAREEWKKDEEVWALIRKLQQDSSTSDTFSWQNDSLWYKDRLYLCLPKSEGKSVIMVVVDKLTKYAHFCALSHPIKASTVSTAFMETIQKLHGNPKIIVSDRDPIFTGNFWTELFSCLCTQLAHSSSYHPQSDGKTEIVNKCLEGYLHCFVSDKQTQWVKWLPLAEWWYNTSFHTATKMTPFMALYGYEPPSIASYLRENSKVQAVEQHIEHQQQVLQLLKDNLVLAQNRMKQ
eukprot:PITA_26716